MRIVIFSDIHGNFVSFESAVADIKQQSPDALVCLGDTIANGPQPHESLALLQALDCPVVMGNTDAFILNPVESHPTSEKLIKVEAQDLWCAAQLSDDEKAFVQTFQPCVAVDLGAEKTLLCFHGSPHSYDDIIVATTPDDELDAKLRGYHATFMAGGHTHTQLLRRHHDMFVINPGSIGLPFETLPSGETFNPAWAEYALLDVRGDDVRVTFRRVPVDVGAIRAAAEHSDLPHRDWWASEWR